MRVATEGERKREQQKQRKKIRSSRKTKIIKTLSIKSYGHKWYPPLVCVNLL